MTRLNVSAQMSEENEEAAVQKMAELEALFPFLIGLSTDDRMSLPKLGKKNLDFCERTLIYAKDNEILVTKFLDVEEIERDMVLLKQMQRILSILSPFYQMMEDTYTELGAEVYSASRTIYRTAKNADKAGVPGMPVIVRDLAERYKKQFSKKDESPEDTLKKNEKQESLKTVKESSKPEQKA